VSTVREMSTLPWLTIGHGHPLPFTSSSVAFGVHRKGDEHPALAHHWARPSFTFYLFLGGLLVSTVREMSTLP